ncbi:DUF2029 domain-containing protein [Loigolactobacillus bifermentans]|jgi:Gpi18-like mannosyltransferase|nr:DUF2029 domain-containing protein [Loigolactobacillus bifermentans]
MKSGEAIMHQKTIKVVSIYLLISVIIVESLCAATFWGKFDILTYNFPWAKLAASRWLQLYQPHYAGGYLVNYPPLLPTLFWPFGKIINFFNLSLSKGSGYQLASAFLTIKFQAMIFHWLIAAFVYWKSHSKIMGLGLASLILINPALWFNAAFWGQLDTALIFFIVLSFYYLSQRHFYLASFWFGLGCLAKLQFFYLVPLFGLTLLVLAKWRQTIYAVCLVIGVNILGWLPFMIAMRQITLPIKVITSSLNQYPELFANAFNGWAGVLKPQMWYRRLKMTNHIFGRVTFSQFNTVVLILIVGGLCLLFLQYWRQKRQNLPIALIGAIYSGFIFFFTTGQHERYQMGMLGFVILWVLLQNEWPLSRSLATYGWFTFIIFINEIFVYLSIYFNTKALTTFNQLLRVGGVINTLMFIIWVGLIIWQRKQQGSQSDEG